MSKIINWDKMTATEKMKAIEEELGLITHMGTTKDALIEAMRYLYDQFKQYEKALELTCEYIAEVDCPYSVADNDVEFLCAVGPELCEKDPVECWQKYYLSQAKEGAVP